MGVDLIERTSETVNLALGDLNEKKKSHEKG